MWSKENGGKSKEKEASEMHDFIKEIEHKNLTAHHSSLTSFYHYRDLGIIGEPYFDIDFSEVLYLTDTGRRWDGGKVSVRDKIGSREYEVGSKEYGVRSMERIGEKEKGRKGEEARERKGEEERERRGEREKIGGLPLNLKYRFHSTNDIIKAAEEGRLPDKIMMTFHPQRWHNRWVPWVKELVWQNVKNVGKLLLVKVRSIE